MKSLPRSMATARVLSDAKDPQPTCDSPSKTNDSILVEACDSLLEQAHVIQQSNVAARVLSDTNDPQPTSASAEQLLEASDSLLEQVRALEYEGFPTYEEYLRRENLDGTLSCLSRSSVLLDVNVEQSRALGYEGFPTYKEYLRRENLDGTLSCLSRSSELLDVTVNSPSINETAASGKALNLHEFTARELLFRTHSDLNSLSNSPSPCGLVLKSTREQSTQTTTGKYVQRTSTPVTAGQFSSRKPREIDGGGGTVDSVANLTAGLFLEETRISSVRQSSSSAEMSISANEA